MVRPLLRGLLFLSLYAIISKSNLKQKMLEISTNTTSAYEPVQEALDHINGALRHPQNEDLEALFKKFPGDDETLHRIISLEGSIIGERDTENPDLFLQRHREYLEECDTRLTEIYFPLKERVTRSVAEYIGEDETDIAALQDTFNQRLDHVSGLQIADPYLSSGNLASFRTGLTRKLEISSLLFMGLDSGEISQEGAEDLVVAHEIIHGFMTSARTSGFFKRLSGIEGVDLNTRNGFSTVHSFDDKPVDSVGEALSSHGWISESAMEHVRQRALKTDTSGYVIGVALLRTIYDMNPALEDTVNSVLFRDSPPSQAVAEIENMLGPLFLEDIDVIFKEHDIVDDKELIKSKVLDRLADSISSDKVSMVKAKFEEHHHSVNNGSSDVTSFMDKYRLGKAA